MKFNLDNFKAPDLEIWRSKIKAEIKASGDITYTNKVEGIQFDPLEKKFEYDFGTEQVQETNDWGITAYVAVQDEKTANTLALKCLGQGANVLYLNISSSITDWRVVFKDIHLDYIHVIVSFKEEAELKAFINFIPNSAKENISVSIDPFCLFDSELIIESGFKVMVLSLIHI